MHLNQNRFEGVAVYCVTCAASESSQTLTSATSDVAPIVTTMCVGIVAWLGMVWILTPSSSKKHLISKVQFLRPPY